MKSHSLEPKQEIVFLGLVFNSKKMTITLTDDKKEKRKGLCQNILHDTLITIRSLASLIGNFTAAFPAMLFGKLHYRQLERQKIEALKVSKGNIDKKLIISKAFLDDLQWWLDNIMISFRTIKVPDIDKTITDAIAMVIQT